MSKGVRKSRANPLDKVAQMVVAPGAKVFPRTECDDYPEGIPLPDGIRVRTGRGVEVRFVLGGERISETVRGRPTVAFVQEVARKRERVEQLIGLNRFDEAEYALEFPDSKRLAALVPRETTVYTVWQALEDWYAARKGTWGGNTDDDYRRAIRNQLIPLKLSEAAQIRRDEYIRPGKDFTPPVEWSLPRHEGGPSSPVDPSDHEILGNLPLSRLNDVLFNQIRSQLLEGRGVKRVNNMMANLRGAIERAHANKLIESNPLSLVKPLRKTLKEEAVGCVMDDDSLDSSLLDDDDSRQVESFYRTEGKPDPFSMRDIQVIVEHLDAPMANQLMFSFWTGLRTGETIALRESDLQLDKNRIRVRRSVSRGKLKRTKTDRERWVELLPPAREALEAQMKLFGAPDGWVFPNPFTRQRWANDSKITKRWERALKAAGVRYRRPYQTRHTYASMMLSAGEHTMHVAGQMGHADWTMLVKVYAQWMPAAAETRAGSYIRKVQEANWGKLAEVLSERAHVAADEDAYAGDSDGTESENELEAQ
ncbi:tyrosine-type recombinase/integrase [Nitrogeniibacter aestuarii]|uniref:tyrosine-type recombinase/integrase n=1 Tax=Nitrogeniibacter aestuarii TaxID=2815343 RepID=UPI001E4F06A8|nr:tyrosine-type recombinase/integrase [Nitrogeniibacter aestuarii]